MNIIWVLLLPILFIQIPQINFGNEQLNRFAQRFEIDEERGIAGNNRAFYEYDYTNRTWDLVGYYDVKKVDTNTSGVLFLLTNDGNLYHKGTAITDVADEHTELTQIFPQCYFHDFTFGGNTLTVLKE